MENKKCVKINGEYSLKNLIKINSDETNYSPTPEQTISSLMNISFCELKTKSISDRDFAIFSTENDMKIALKTYFKNNELIIRGRCIYNDFMNCN
jgi:hypothetical protein